MLPRSSALLLLIALLSACAPSAASPPGPVAAPPTLPPSPTAPVPTAPEEPTSTPPPAAAPVATPTYRGNALQATDPTTVNLASGMPTLLEFFAFW